MLPFAEERPAGESDNGCALEGRRPEQVLECRCSEDLYHGARRLHGGDRYRFWVRLSDRLEGVRNWARVQDQTFTFEVIC